MALRRLVALWWALSQWADGASRGYLFVSNRLDEVLVAALELRRVEPGCNMTLVADGATLGELASRERVAASGRRVFDVVLRSEDLLPGTSTGDSMGFRVQKLRALRSTPYDLTLYMDSDTLACRPLGEIFSLLGDADAGGVAQHETIVNGGVLAYRRNARAFALWERWEKEYVKVMATTRREQPVLQEALRWAAETGAATFVKLPRSQNCRGAESCGEVVTKAGDRTRCALLHGHGVARAATAAPEAPITSEAARAAALLDAYRRPCPALGGGHATVVVAEAGGFGGGAASLDAALEGRLRALTKDNDASPCRVDHRASPSWLDKSLKKCLKAKTRYATVAVVGKLPDPPVHIRGAPVLIAWIRDPADAAKKDGCAAFLAGCATSGTRAADCADCADRLVTWFCAADAKTCDAKGKVAGALENADVFFQVVVVETRLKESFRTLETVLPSHFLRLTDGVPDDAPNARHRQAAVDALAGDLARFGATPDAPSALAYVRAALDRDLALYDALAAKLDGDIAACALPEETRLGFYRGR